MQFSGPSTWRQYAVVQSFKHAWKGYKDHAWGHDNVKPVSGMISEWFSLGLTIVDSIDTAYIMGLHEGNKYYFKLFNNILVLLIISVCH